MNHEVMDYFILIADELGTNGDPFAWSSFFGIVFHHRFLTFDLGDVGEWAMCGEMMLVKKNDYQEYTK